MTKSEFDELTMDQKARFWDCMTATERSMCRDLSDLTDQLTGLEGQRVEVVDLHGSTRRFIVGRSTGWRPCHIEIKTRRSFGGMSADKAYRSVRIVSKGRVR